jgi:hypothetical protein
MKPGHVAGPVILIGLGMLFLINNFVIDISFGRLVRDFWPFILIIVGVAQLPGVFLGGPKGRWGYLNGSVILITLGFLFALQTLGDVSFGRTWPALLVVIGVLTLVKATVRPMLYSDRVERFFRGGFQK